MEEDELSKFVDTMPKYVYQEENKSGITIKELPNHDYDPGMDVPRTYPSIIDNPRNTVFQTYPQRYPNLERSIIPNDSGIGVPRTYPSIIDNPRNTVFQTYPQRYPNLERSIIPNDPGIGVPRTYPSIIDNPRNTVFQTYPQRYPNLERSIIPNDPGMAVPYSGPNYDPKMAVPYTGPNYDPGFLIPSTGPHYDPGMDVPYTYPSTHDRFIRIDESGKIIGTIPILHNNGDPGFSIPYTYPNSITLPDYRGFITIETEDGPKTVPYGHNPTRSNLVDYVRIDPETGEVKHYKKVEYLYEGYYDPETKQYIENPKSEYVENNFHVTLLKNNTLIGALKNISVDDIDLELIKNGNWPAKYESLLSDVQSIIDFFEGTDSMFSDINGELGNSLLDNFNISKEELENIKKYVSNNLSAVTELLEQLKQKIIEAEKIEEEKEAKELEKQSLLSNQPREYNPCTHKDAEGKTLHPSGDRNSEYVIWQNNLNTITAEIAELENYLIENKKEQESYLQRIRELNNTTIV